MNMKTLIPNTTNISLWNFRLRLNGDVTYDNLDILAWRIDDEGNMVEPIIAAPWTLRPGWCLVSEDCEWFLFQDRTQRWDPSDAYEYWDQHYSQLDPNYKPCEVEQSSDDDDDE